MTRDPRAQPAPARMPAKDARGLFVPDDIEVLEAARRLGISPTAVRHRIATWGDRERALTQPKRQGRAPHQRYPGDSPERGRESDEEGT